MLLAGCILATSASLAGAQASPDLIVHSIELRRHEVFDSSEASNWLFRLANKLHYETRESVVRPELLFRVGQPFDSARVDESARNLRTLALFRDVDIDSVRTDSGLVVRVTTRDAWTTNMDFTVQSAGSQAAYSTEFLENNFLGTGSRVLLKYGKYPDRNTGEFEFAQPRLIARRIGVDLYHEIRSDGNRSIATLDYPFRSLESPFGASLTAREFDGRVLQFLGGQPVAHDTLQERQTLVRLQAAAAVHGNPHGYVRVGVIAQLQRNDNQAESATTPFPNNVTLAAGPLLSLSRAHFVTTSNFEHLQQKEDVDLSTTLSLALLVAPKAWGFDHDGVAPFASIRVGRNFLGGFTVLEGDAGGVFSSTGLDSGTVVIGGTAVLRPSPHRQRLLLHAEAAMSRHPAPGEEFDLGFGLGPRAFGTHAFTGDRMYYATAEYRYTIAPELGRLAGLGLALFADQGGAWYSGDAPRNGTDVGIGLRIGPTRQADLRTVRIDLVRQFTTDISSARWVVVIGKGFTFQIAQ